MIIQGKAVIIPLDKVDTDVMYPGSQLHITEPARMKDYLLEGLDPSVRQLLGSETILFVGANFGASSAREHAPLALKAAGVRAVVGRSFARIFFRNCINLGLPSLPTGSSGGERKPGSNR
jgi:3-isopropylmalate/(R)-2-methylmalate dehydratase small subunit